MTDLIIDIVAIGIFVALGGLFFIRGLQLIFRNMIFFGILILSIASIWMINAVVWLLT